MMMKPNPHCIFFGLNEVQLMKLSAIAEYIEVPPGTFIIQEHAMERCFYYIIQGEIQILKNTKTHEHVLAHIGAGETIGEMALVDEAPRSASVKANQDCKLYKFDIDKLKENPELADIFLFINSKVSQQLSKRLKSSNEFSVNTLKEKYIMSIFSIRMLVLVSLYALSLNLLEKGQQYLADSSIESMVLIIIYALVVFSIIRKSEYPLSFYGLTRRNWQKYALESVLFTLPLLAAVLLIKWLVITYIPSAQHFPLFDPSAIFKEGTIFSWHVYWIALIFYAAFCPLQEFMVRGCVQTSFQNLLEGPEYKIKWQAIIISNLIFASSHSHLSLGFALSAFIPGIFWGWLYYRQKSLVGVSISHIMVGIWAAFIVGFQNIL